MYSNIQQTREKPGAALQTPLSLTDLLIDLVILQLKYLYGATKPKRLKMVVLPQKQTILHFFRNSKSLRASKSLYWFQSYGNFDELVDFAYQWSCIRKGLPWSLRSRLVDPLFWWSFSSIITLKIDFWKWNCLLTLC